MNNLLTLRSLFQLSRDAVAAQVQLDPATLDAFEQGTQEPTITQWQALAELYSTNIMSHKHKPIWWNQSIFV